MILEQAAALKDAVPIILHHHERYAGHGYPFGLRANEIPLGARIVAIADAYDAMIHDRPYKRAMTHDQAIAELRRHAGTQFDPELVSLFCDLYAAHAPQPDPTVLAMTEATDARPRWSPVGLGGPRQPRRGAAPRSRPRRVDVADAATASGIGVGAMAPARRRRPTAVERAGSAIAGDAPSDGLDCPRRAVSRLRRATRRPRSRDDPLVRRLAGWPRPPGPAALGPRPPSRSPAPPIAVRRPSSPAAGVGRRSAAAVMPAGDAGS